MGDIQKTIEHIQEAVRPYLRSREHAEQVRRLLCLHLREALGNYLPGQPLSLIDGTFSVTQDDSSTGLEQEYLEAVQRYTSTVAEFQKVQNAGSTQAAGESGRTASRQPLDDHILSVKLQKKGRSLEVVHKHIDAVAQQPMAGDAAHDLRSVLEDAKPLPEVPSKIVDSFATEGNAGGADLGDFMNRLDMILLKSRLLLKREAELLQEAKSNSSATPGSASDGARARALDATRTQLINWIEEELSKASDEGDTPAEEGVSGNGSSEDTGVTQKDEKTQEQIKKRIEKDLGGIEAKYAQYVSSRKTLIEALGRSRSLLSKTIHDHPPSEEVAALVEQHQPMIYLELPYIANALSKLQEQRAHISHKTSLNTSLGRQLKDASLAIEHLADESQLLPDYPMPFTQPAAQSSEDSLGATSAEKPDLTGQVKPWAYAADSSKIAAFETITEKIEEAQMAMEDAVATLTKADKLLGKEAQTDSGADEGESDIWLANEGSSSKTKPRAEKKETDEAMARDIFSSLKLNLGLLGRERIH